MRSHDACAQLQAANLANLNPESEGTAPRAAQQMLSTDPTFYACAAAVMFILFPFLAITAFANAGSDGR